MAAPSNISKSIVERLTERCSIEDLKSRLERRDPLEHPLPPRLPRISDYSEQALEARLLLLEQRGVHIEALRSNISSNPESFRGNIENLIGFAKIPVGIIGPLRINGASAHGDFYIPFATTEGVLVASYNRGAHVISQSGGVSTLCLTEAVSRAPCFVFENLSQSSLFLSSVIEHADGFPQVVTKTSNHCKLIDFKTVTNGKEVHIIFEFTTGDASGQNMVTIATHALCEYLLAKSSIRPRRWYLDGNMSGDKKATMNSFLYTRGKKVLAETVIPRNVVRRYLYTEPEDMFEYWQISFMGGTQSGAIGSQGHFANALAALFIACGQDAACVSEASIGLTRMSITEDGSLYVSVSLPNLIVGTVGGGTSLPTSRECLEMIGCFGEGHARKFAEICAAAVLAGEISIIGSFSAGDFAKAHAIFGRKVKKR